MAIYISEKLKQFRKARDLTQEQIADILNNCTDDYIRLMSIQRLAHDYNALGEKEKAKETAQRLPPWGISREKTYEIICDDY